MQEASRSLRGIHKIVTACRKTTVPDTGRAFHPLQAQLPRMFETYPPVQQFSQPQKRFINRRVRFHVLGFCESKNRVVRRTEL
jgi:hypothetical protein